MSIFALYGHLTNLLAPAIRFYLLRRAGQSKEDPERLGERLGFPGLARPSGPLIWAHAASVGEALSLLPLLDALRSRLPHATLLVTSGTVTSAKLLAERLPPKVLHQFVPVDIRNAVRRFLDHWKPQLALLVESELWPNLVIESHRRRVPVVLLNGRLSNDSFNGWKRYSHFASKLFSSLSLVLAQDEQQAARWRVLGVTNVACAGDLKAASAPLPMDAAAHLGLSSEIGERPVWLAASTHEGEEAVVFATHQRLVEDFPDLLTLIAPRHPKRSAEITEAAFAVGITLGRRSAHDPIARAMGVYLIDTLGELGLFYRLSPIVLVAGSLGVPGSIGGHNPLEAARLGRAILHGPDMANCSEAARVLDENGAALIVDGAGALAAAIHRLLENPQEVAFMGNNALKVAQNGNQVIVATMSALEPWLKGFGSYAFPNDSAPHG